METLKMNELIGNLMTYESKKNQENNIGTKRKDKTISLRAIKNIDYEEKNLALALVTRRFKRMFKKI